MKLAITLVALAAQLALADEQSESVPMPRTVQGVAVGASTNTLQGPLDQRLSLRLASGTLQSFFNEVSKQTKLEFRITQGLEQCEIAAFIHDLTAREVLQMTIGTKGISYQQLGRSNQYTITRWRGGPECPPISKKIPTGKCNSTGNTPISLECKDAPLPSLAELLYDQSDASIIVWNEC
jgi:hypothetical protein